MDYLPKKTLGEWIGFVGSSLLSLGLTIGVLMVAELRPSWGLAGFFTGVAIVLIFSGAAVHELRRQPTQENKE